MTTSPPYIVLDLETLHSADSCRHCGKPQEEHLHFDRQDGLQLPCLADTPTTFAPLGWSNKADLGLSVGCYWHSVYNRMVFFDAHTLEATVRDFVEARPLLVSFNGRGFDFPLMRGILRRRAECLPPNALELVDLCDQFKALCAQGYDILEACWNASPETKRTKDLNTLDSLARANGLGSKTGHGAQAPRDWAAGRYAQVVNYCANDVYLTKALFEKVLRQEPVHRSDGSSLLLPLPQEVV